jgi:dihydrofolate reductase
MRKLVAYLFYSVDGVTEAPDKWVQTFDEDMGEEISAVIAEQDDVLLGRVTYQEWAAYWPTATDEPFASFINNVRKHVVSTSLDQVDWRNATLLKGDLREAVAKLKAAPGKTIGVHGSIKLVRSLVRERLLDELTLVMVPVIAGSGRHLFEPGDRLESLKLARSRATRTGTAILTYQLASTTAREV